MRTFAPFLFLGVLLSVACSSSSPGVVEPSASDASISCGLSGGAKCGLGEACSSGLMCESGNCVSNRCAASSCTNSKRDGTETGVDCGGSCSDKCDGEACSSNTGCKSRLCVSGKCAASGTKACGVGTATLCANGSECGVAADCTSDVCTQNGLCEAPGAQVHADGQRNGGETGVDCGGTVSSTKLCGAGEGCKVSGDCEGLCPAGGGVCAAATSSDGKRNAGETDVDCGGANAPSCTQGKQCASNTDCALKYCNAGQQCAVPTATDGIKNGAETDVDCGGGAVTEGATSYTAPRCEVTKSCTVDADCTSAVCAENGKCMEAPSCRRIHGGQTCGAGEYGVSGSQHESCCKSLPVPGLTMVQGGVSKQVYLDKYEITAGRVRLWLEDIRRQNVSATLPGGELNVQKWVRERVAQDPLLKAYYDPAVVQQTYYCDAKDVQNRCTHYTYVNLPPSLRLLPEHDGNQYDQNADGSAFNFPVGVTTPRVPVTSIPVGVTSVTLDMGAFAQLGAQSYFRDVGFDGASGCSMNAGGFGHRTILLDAASAGGVGALETWNGEPVSRTADQAWLDEKSANCMTPLMFAAFCAWDGGYVMSRDALIAAYGSKTWPWGDTPTLSGVATAAEELGFFGNFNLNNSFNTSHAPKYLYPSRNYSTFGNDLSPIIAAPGRMVQDRALVSRPGQSETWMDLGSNMLEWSLDTTSNRYAGWTGSSFEGHGLSYARSWNPGLTVIDKYGKGGSRCMRLK